MIENSQISNQDSVSDKKMTRGTSATLIPSIICILAAIFYVYDYFIQVAPSIMTQQLMRAFHLGASNLGVLSASFFYSYTLMQIPSGLLLDYFGPRKVLTIAALFTAVGVWMFGSTHLFGVAATGRFLIGVGSSGAFLSAIFLIARFFSHRKFPLLSGFIQLAGCIGSILGQAPLALIINRYGWRQAMFWVSMATFGLMFVYAIVIRDQRKGSLPTLTDSGIRLSKIKQLLKNKQLMWIALLGCLCWVPVGAVGALWGVPYLMKIYGWTNVHAGKICSVFWVAVGVASPLLGWFSVRVSSRKIPMVLGFCCALVGIVLFLLAPYCSPFVAICSLLLLGFSAGIQSLMFSVVKDIVPYESFGAASGIINMTAILGGGLSQTVIGFLLSQLWHGGFEKGIPLYMIENYQLSFAILIVTAILGLVISVIKIRETHCCEQVQGVSECEQYNV